MKGQETLFSSASDEWSTPPKLFELLNYEFDFELDCAASAENRKCPAWLGPGSKIGQDALTVPWSKRNWLNPPYSACFEFVRKARFECEHNKATTVLLVPSRTDTKWWHRYVWDADRITKLHRPDPGTEVRFIEGRVCFGVAREAKLASLRERLKKAKNEKQMVALGRKIAKFTASSDPIIYDEAAPFPSVIIVMRPV